MSMTPFNPSDVTGLVLAGGLGSRMGGVDKGLQPWRGRPLVAHVLERLAPQVGEVLINANRNLATYGQFGPPVLPDSLPDHPGPLAGFLAGLQACRTPWLVTAPCDSPLLPQDLVQQLHQGATSADVSVVMAETQGKYQPVFCLMRVGVASSLLQFLAEGGRKIDRWALSAGAVAVPFDDASAFANANTLEELRAMESSGNV
jgi:molybdenum cofactor guanylyltransferase